MTSCGVSFFLFFLIYANEAYSQENNLELSPGIPTHEFGSSAYYIQRFSKATHDQVQIFCKDLSMEVVNIGSRAENDYLFQTIGDFVDYQDSVFWTSGLKTDNIWYWTSTGKPFSYTNWSSSVGDGNCLQIIYSSSNTTMFWNATDCSNQRSYVICETNI